MRWWWGKKAQAPPRIPVKWDFYIRRRGEDLVSVALNLALADPRLRPQSLKVVLWIKVKMRQPTEDGTASPAESPVILQIEDAIADDVGNRLGAIFAGHIMGCGYHECVLYAPTSARVSAITSEITSRFREYQITASSAHDPTWSVYMEELYPDQFGKHQILNRQVLLNLKKGGDTLQTPRLLRHWIYFKDAESRSGFVERAKSFHFEVSESELPVDSPQQMRFCANIARVDFVKPHEIDGLIGELVALASEFGGDYDGWETEIIKS